MQTCPNSQRLIPQDTNNGQGTVLKKKTSGFLKYTQWFVVAKDFDLFSWPSVGVGVEDWKRGSCGHYYVLASFCYLDSCW